MRIGMALVKKERVVPLCFHLPFVPRKGGDIINWTTNDRISSLNFGRAPLSKKCALAIVLWPMPMHVMQHEQPFGFARWPLLFLP